MPTCPAYTTLTRLLRSDLLAPGHRGCGTAVRRALTGAPCQTTEEEHTRL
uniref:Uncharacterized protein n=1 Tax=Anguilla anguilla TaxID=7936 RepID=A0A0E9Q1C2_ANGAN